MNLEIKTWNNITVDAKNSGGTDLNCLTTFPTSNLGQFYRKYDLLYNLF